MGDLGRGRRFLTIAVKMVGIPDWGRTQTNKLGQVGKVLADVSIRDGVLSIYMKSWAWQCPSVSTGCVWGGLDRDLLSSLASQYSSLIEIL